MTLTLLLLLLGGGTLLSILLWWLSENKSDDWAIPAFIVTIPTGLLLILSFVAPIGKEYREAVDCIIVASKYSVFVEFEDGTHRKFDEAEAVLNADNLIVYKVQGSSPWGYRQMATYEFEIAKGEKE